MRQSFYPLPITSQWYCNIHATELAPSIVYLYLLQTLVTAYGTQPDITRCLDSRTFYICPRVNPDGAE
ncbi:M14 family zinc carboxypeptidase [Tolypothrix sp. PCC 7910]|uniref:M14 family zinc carboxypeptidase n=1 Tax=Tolypothrix sp. PCC 7910 TaxID=2099387 RepID=UPI001AD7C25B|nr:M14 family zinc carboxypeptidase [Tolypothrix sp. PCC 7910]